MERRSKNTAFAEKQLSSSEIHDCPVEEIPVTEFYNIENEKKFVENNQHLPLEDIQFYLRENMRRFIYEFAGKVPYTVMQYSLEEDGLHFPGIEGPVVDGYIKTAKMTDENSRERAEATGFKRLENAYTQNKANVGIFFSPPSDQNGFSDYAFGMVSYKKTINGKEYVMQNLLRYYERKGEITESQKILTRLFGEDMSHTYNNVNDFLRSPITFESSDIDKTVNEVMQIVGIDAEDIQKSKAFEDKVEESLSPWIEEYVESIMGNEDARPADLLLKAIFNKAKELKKETEGKIKIEERGHSEKENFYYYSSQIAQVQGGGSCPVTTSSSTLSALLGSNGILNYSTADLLTKDKQEHFVCPKCNYKATGPVGNECPNCHLTKEKYAEEGGKTC